MSNCIPSKLSVNHSRQLQISGSDCTRYSFSYFWASILCKKKVPKRIRPWEMDGPVSQDADRGLLCLRRALQSADGPGRPCDTLSAFWALKTSDSFVSVKSFFFFWYKTGLMDIAGSKKHATEVNEGRYKRMFAVISYMSCAITSFWPPFQDECSVNPYVGFRWYSLACQGHWNCLEVWSLRCNTLGPARCGFVRGHSQPGPTSFVALFWHDVCDHVNICGLNPSS